MGVKTTNTNKPNLTKTDGHLLEYFRNTFVAGGGGTNADTAQGLTATGGVISDYVDGSDIYRAHIFTSSGTFDVSAIGDYPADVEYLVVAGGGGGSFGGGGSGGVLSNHPDIPAPRRGSAFPVSVTSYPVSIGAGGAFRNQGSSSSFGPISATGGGYGGGVSGNTGPGGPGGSGGGGGHNPGGSGVGDPGGPAPDANQGFAGGSGFQSGSYFGGGGGGGAGGAGSNAPGTAPGNNQDTGGNGGVGLQITIAGPLNDGIGAPGPSPGRWIGGGGGGAYSGPNEGLGGGPGGPYAGGGNGSSNSSNTIAATSGTYATGGGGGGGNGAGKSGGSGIVVVRYQIGQLTATAKATGGAISYYNGKTIHTFTSSGDFINPSPIDNAEFVIVGGGGGGGVPQGGGGGAGGMVVHAGPFTIPAATNAVVVGAGGPGFPQGGSAANGTSSTITFPGAPVTYSAYRGGGGGDRAAGQDGGSGGGGSFPVGAAGSAVNPATNPGATEYGNAGGAHASSTGGGGGGAGGSAPGSNGVGGIGRQLPSTYQDPKSSVGTPGPGGAYYVGGGGAGFYISPGNPANSVAGGGGGGPFPYPSPTTVLKQLMDGDVNTGGGGCGPTINNPPSTYFTFSGSGGSGIVLIAYPS